MVLYKLRVAMDASAFPDKRHTWVLATLFAIVAILSLILCVVVIAVVSALAFRA
jgi:hypothetical protein